MKTIQLFTKILLSASIATAVISCSGNKEAFDATGTFEATEVTVSAEAVGKIIALNVEEGQELTINQQVGSIDSMQIYLKKEQLLASKKALNFKKPDIKKQLAALDEQIATAKTEKKRIEKLIASEAINKKQLDDVNSQIAVLEKQRTATLSTLELTTNSLNDEDKALLMQVEQLNDQLQKCRIVAPISGTVLAKYAETGELASTGKAIFKIADIKNITLKAYVSSDQLTTVKIGQKVKVYGDLGKTESKEYNGVVNWISPKAEFTPKTIQTRDERANLVYAVKIAVVNDGYLKIGMYGNVKFQ